MMPDALDLTLTGGTVLGPDGLADRPLAMSGGHIHDNGGRVMDASGYWILPGIVDLHGDGFERHLAPRRGAQGELGPGLDALDRELAAAGITTAVLAQFYSWEGGMRGPEFAWRLAAALDATRTLTDLRLQLRLEIHMLDAYDDARALIARHAIPYVVFNDHLPHAALDQGKTPPRLTGQALKAGRSPEAHLALLKAMHARKDDVPTRLAALAAHLAGLGVLMGSHDDHTAEDRARARAIGARIAEFPETRAAAEAAVAAGDPVLMGAPNVLRGGSHKKNQRAADLIADGLVSALVSDYLYPAPHRAALNLVETGLSLAEAWALVSTRPARILGLNDRGDLTPGKRADLVVVEKASGRVEATVCAGQISYLSGSLANRWMGAST